MGSAVTDRWACMERSTAWQARWRDVDGGRPPYEHVLFPPFDTKVAQRVCADLERALDIGVSIVDLNDYGGSIRAVSPRSLSAETLATVLGDNPLGQRLTSTPFVLVRPA